MVRLKHRYLVVRVTEPVTLEPAKITESSIYHGIMSKTKYIHGDYGVAAISSGFNVKYINKHTGLVVIRVRRGPHQLVASILPFLDKLNDARINVSTLYTGACIRQCLLFIKKYQMDEYNAAVANMKEDQKMQLKDSYMNFTFKV